MQDLIRNSAAATETALSGRRSRVGWLILLALATLQFAIAQHSSAHEIEDLTEPCQFCIQLDDSLPAIDDAAPAASTPTAAVAPVLPGSKPPARRYPRAGASRAPPVS